jgi:TetR/AcrR family transcriptional regulator
MPRKPAKRVKRTKRRMPVGAHREAILRAAREEFSARGFAGATTVAIAKRAGVTQPLIHHHFGSKAKLWSAMLAELFGALREALAAADTGDERTRIERLLRTVIEFSAERPELSRLIRLESSSGQASFEVLYRVHLDPLLRFFDETLTRAEKAGIARRLDRGFVYFAMLGASTQIFAEPAAARRGFGLEPFDPKTARRYADFIIDVVLAGIWV